MIRSIKRFLGNITKLRALKFHRLKRNRIIRDIESLFVEWKKSIEAIQDPKEKMAEQLLIDHMRWIVTRG